MMYLLALVVLVIIVGIVFFLKLDCDLTLAWCLRFGSAPSAVFSRKVVWITGCSCGIGEALAVEFAVAGSRLVLSARREHLLHKVKEKCLKASNGKLRPDDILVLPLDLLAFETHPKAAETVVKYFKQIDVFINNAGRSQRGVLFETAFEVDRQVVELDLLAPISITKAVIPYMVEQGRGHVICTSSVAGKFAAPGSATYSAAKHGLQGYFDTLRIEGASSNISVTLACPGPVFSDALVSAFTDTPDQKLNVEMGSHWSRMTAARCAHLMAVGAANKLYEVWLSANPELFYCYIFQYTPYFAKILAVHLGQHRMNKVKAGIADLH